MNFSDFFKAIKQGAVVITVNQRLSRHLTSRVEQALVDEGAAVWASPMIMSFDVWLLQCWQRRFDLQSNEASASLVNKTLLTQEQALVIWERVIRQTLGAELLNVPATAKAASKARQLSLQWMIAENAVNDISTGVDMASFNQWHDAYKDELNKSAWIDRAQLIKTVSELVDQDCLLLPNQIIFSGFEIYTPTQQSLHALLIEKGHQLSEFSAEAATNQTHVLKAIDRKEEVKLMAQWARERLDENPDNKIGIVVPDLEVMRESIESAFKTVFYPSVVYPVDVPFEKPYNVSLGQSLLSYSPIQQSLRLLQFCSQPITFSELCLLLRSSFITAGQKEWGQRARLEVVLRKKGILSCSVKQLRNSLQAPKDDESLCPLLLKCLNEVIELLEAKPNRVLPSDWVQLFRSFLATMGVQGDRVLSSTEYQVFQVWDDVLKSFSTLDEVYSVITFETALNALRKILLERVFQPETPTAAIQIMGLMEASGHTFDALWVCGLDDKTWPQSPNPSPFLPLAEQRNKGLVQSSAEHQYQHAKIITKNWARSAKTVVFSFSHVKDEAVQAKSSLIEGYPVITKEQLLQQLPVNPIEHRVGNKNFKWIEDVSGPLLEKSETVRGGVSILKDQAACPFKAYVHFRLQTNALQEPEPGIDARLRGSLVHRSLEELWTKIKTHKALCDLSVDEQYELVKAIVTAVVQTESKRTAILKKALGQLETERITQLLMAWLNIDRQREPFEVIATELKQLLSVGELQLNTIIDRVDKLPDGSLAIIDYKTGDCSINSWFGLRPEEPQLPLYSVFSEGNVGSISFAQLKKGQTQYQGLTDSDDHFSTLKNLADKKVKADYDQWNNQMDHWRTVLGGLSDEFVTANARVSPTAKACQYCDLTSLCRINEQITQRAAEDE